MRKLLLAMFVVLSGAAAVLAQWPGEKLKGGDLRASFLDALRIMGSTVEQISHGDVRAVKPEVLSKIVDGDLAGQFLRMQGLLKNNPLDGLSLSSLGAEDIKLLTSVLPTEAKRLTTEGGLISGEAVIHIFDSLHQRTIKQGLALVKALELHRQIPQDMKISVQLITSHGQFVKECARNMQIISLLQNVSIVGDVQK